MKNFKKAMAVVATAALAITLTGCGGGDSAKHTKVGYGMITSVGDKGEAKQINTTMATVALDSKGKISYVNLDVAQQDTNKDTMLKTKVERKEDYGMKDTSAKAGIGKELYEQVDFLEKHLIGKTADEVKGIETFEKNADHPKVPKEGTDLATGCTIDIGAFQEAIAKAFDNMADVKADKIGAGETISVDAKKGQVDNTVASVALDSKGKIVWSNIDVQQTKSADEVRSKMELKEGYNMKDASGIKKEFYEQVDFLKTKLIGLDAAGVAGIETYEKNASHPKVPKEGTDIATGCTIDIGAFQEALAEAFETAK